MKLGGWQRLWVVVSGLYLLFVIIFVSFTVPRPENIPHSQVFYDQLRPESRRRILGIENLEKFRSEKMEYLEEARRRGLVQEAEMANGHVITFSRDVAKNDVEVTAREYWHLVEKEARRKLLQYALNAFLWWVGPVLVLYGLGRSVEWIYKGFKGQ